MPYVLHESIGYLVRSVTRALRARFNRNLEQAGLDVTSDQWAVLVTLQYGDGRSQSELGDVVMQDKTAVTRMIDDLERRGLVLRVPDGADRRRRLIYLTAPGRAMVQRLLPVVEATLSAVAEGVPDADMQVCKAVLRRILGNLET